MFTRRPIPVTITLWLGWVWTFIFFSNLQTMVYLGDLWFWGLTLTVTALLSVFFRMHFGRFYLSAVFVVWLIALHYAPIEISFLHFLPHKRLYFFIQYCLVPLLGLVLINLPNSMVWLPTVWLQVATGAKQEVPPKALMTPLDWALGLGLSFQIYTFIYWAIVVPKVMLLLLMSSGEGSQGRNAQVIAAIPVIYFLGFVLLRFRLLRAGIFRDKVSPAMILIPLLLGALVAWFLMLSDKGSSRLWSFLPQV